GRPKLFFDADQLVVFRNAVGAGKGARLDLARVGGHSQIGNGAVLRLAGAVGENNAETGLLRRLHGVQRLGQRADLVDLDQDRVTGLFINAALQAFGIRDEKIVAYQLHLVAKAAGQLRPAGPVVFGHAVFDGG